MVKLRALTSPSGTSGLAAEPWSKGEVYAVAANWAQATSPLLTYGPEGWHRDYRGRQVADFQHSKIEALDSIIREAIVASGEEPEDGEVEAILADAVAVPSE